MVGTTRDFSVSRHATRAVVTGHRVGGGLLLAVGTLACALAQAQPTDPAGVAGTTSINGGALFVNGAIDNTLVRVSNGGRLGGDGVIGGTIVLEDAGMILPGDDANVGELDASAMEWQAGGSFAFQLGVDDGGSDHLAVLGSLDKSGVGSFAFEFRDGLTQPSAGTTYTLIDYASVNGFDVGDFSYTYTGSVPDLVGVFNLTPTALLFTVQSTPVDLQSFRID